MDQIVKPLKPINDIDSAPTGSKDKPSQAPRGKRRMILISLVIFIILAAIAGPWLAARWSHVSVIDSRIASNLITVSSEVSGRVTAIPVIAGDRVTKGQLLASIDRETAQFELQALDAQILGVEAQQSQLRTQQDMIKTQVAAKLTAAQTQVIAAQESHKASQVTLDNARSRFERVNSLAKSKVISEQVLEEAQAALSTAQHQEQVTAANIQSAIANLSVIKAEETQIALLERQIASLDAQVAVIKAEQSQKNIDLNRREIRAEFDGVIDSVSVEAGEYAAPGSRLLIYHNPDTVWVDANVKETDFGKLKIGAKAVITVDAYPDLKFEGGGYPSWSCSYQPVCSAAKP